MHVDVNIFGSDAFSDLSVDLCAENMFKSITLNASTAKFVDCDKYVWLCAKPLSLLFDKQYHLSLIEALSARGVNVIESEQVKSDQQSKRIQVFCKVTIAVANNVLFDCLIEAGIDRLISMEIGKKKVFYFVLPADCHLL